MRLAPLRGEKGQDMVVRAFEPDHAVDPSARAGQEYHRVSSLKARRRLKTRKPFRSGGPTSRMTSAGFSVCNRQRCIPVATHSGSKPSVRSAYCSVSAMPGSSSTTRMAGFPARRQEAVDGEVAPAGVVVEANARPGGELGSFWCDHASVAPEMPTSRPSSRARAAPSRAPPRPRPGHAIEQPVCRLAGMKPAPMPWMGCNCRRRSPARRSARRRNTFEPGHFAFSTRAQKPGEGGRPVPTPVISVQAPGKSAAISSAGCARARRCWPGSRNWHPRSSAWRRSVPWRARSSRSCPSRGVSSKAVAP